MSLKLLYLEILQVGARRVHLCWLCDWMIKYLIQIIGFASHCDIEERLQDFNGEIHFFVSDWPLCFICTAQGQVKDFDQVVETVQLSADMRSEKAAEKLRYNSNMFTRRTISCTRVNRMVFQVRSVSGSEVQAWSRIQVKLAVATKTLWKASNIAYIVLDTIDKQSNVCMHSRQVTNKGSLLILISTLKVRHPN